MWERIFQGERLQLKLDAMEDFNDEKEQKQRNVPNAFCMHVCVLPEAGLLGSDEELTWGVAVMPMAESALLSPLAKKECYLSNLPDE
jgi:hypothetical protein